MLYTNVDTNEIVDAIQADPNVLVTAVVIKNPDCTMMLNAGEWVLTHEDSTVSIVSDELFNLQYQVLP